MVEGKMNNGILNNSIVIEALCVLNAASVMALFEQTPSPLKVKPVVPLTSLDPDKPPQPRFSL